MRSWYRKGYAAALFYHTRREHSLSIVGGGGGGLDKSTARFSGESGGGNSRLLQSIKGVVKKIDYQLAAWVGLWVESKEY